MSFEPSACHYVRMPLDMYKENLIKINNYILNKPLISC